MPNPYFSFKQFTVYQDKCAMKVGIDGVLLGAWTVVGNAATILDVGTGTGLIALMLAQRSSARITAIDIEAEAVDQALENVENSAWKDRISVMQKSLQEFSVQTTERFDLIVSNPPYFNHSLKTPSESRTIARHTDSLSHAELIENSLKLLSPEGRICLILPVREAEDCLQLAQSLGLHCSRKVQVFPKPEVPAKRLLIELKANVCDTIESDILIEESRHVYSPAFAELCRDFYLKL